MKAVEPVKEVPEEDSPISLDSNELYKVMGCKNRAERREAQRLLRRQVRKQNNLKRMRGVA